MLVSMVGTPQYLAPEVVMQNKQNPGYENVVDSWSVGIIVYRCVAGSFEEDQLTRQYVDESITFR
jgi:serine/threonine/tyrosine protein kinase RAD53